LIYFSYSYLAGKNNHFLSSLYMRDNIEICYGGGMDCEDQNNVKKEKMAVCYFHLKNFIALSETEGEEIFPPANILSSS